MKLTKQMLHKMITEELEEGLRKNPTVSLERLHQLRIKFAKADPEDAGFTQYWMSLGQDHINVEDMEEILTPEGYELYAAGWERGRNFYANPSKGGTPIPDGQQHYANARRAPAPGFFGFKEDKKK